ncbi:hypothetical protein BJP25_15365 [Actinokineospora bangkokensis]|uniref:Carboxylic ester hydrolase n=1 Tax=Actinokineospora bangkokensis TaxID=1193682 RepID=A0A1Q9LPF6_9PSEU|nr:hypothetical protein BJP25_15365 [Actinokineospora bangkokensis]
MRGLVVEHAAGALRGVEVDDGVLSWRGIPYAQPPVGELRLRPPQPVAAWSGTRDATRYGAPAVQPPPARPGLFDDPGAPVLPPCSEDCLVLNVTAPAGGTRRPVVVWLHGGGYQVGSGTDLAGDGASFARSHGLVVVTLNYRLGALGFLAVPGEHPTGALGLHDQVAALRWVRDNIAAFGGDPDRVAVVGLSAGAKSVANLMGSPRARGLFHRAASASGGADHVATPEQAASVTRRFLRELGTDRVRDVSAADLLAAQTALATDLRGTWLWRPAIDGVVLTSRPLDAVIAGSAAGVPLLAQHCLDECLAFAMGAPGVTKHADTVLAGHFGPAGRDALFAAYRRARPDLDETGLRVAVMTDNRYVVPTSRLADAQSAHAPVWRSRFDGPLTHLPEPFDTLPAMHGTDGPLIWAENSRMHQAWGAFLAGAAPTADDLPDWPTYTPERRTTMVISSGGGHTADDPQGAQRAAWDGLDWPSSTWWPLDGIS